MPKPLLKITVILGTTLLPILSIAQGSLTTQNSQPQPAGIKTVTIGDSSTLSMDTTMARYLGMMDELDKKYLKSHGYRIQIFSASGPNGRKDALQKQSEFLKLYSQSSAYTKWSYPNWVVRLGDFRTHLEAMEFHQEIREVFPASFIVKDEIKVE